MENDNIKTMVKNSIIHYGITMTLAGRFYGEKKQSCTTEDSIFCKKGEAYYTYASEKAYRDILSLIDNIL